MRRSHLALQFCYSYAELVERIQDQDADVSLLPYALYYSGSVDIINPGLTIDDLTALYRRHTTDRDLVSGLTAFARMCMAKNLIRYTTHLLSHIIQQTERLRDGECMRSHIATPSAITLELAYNLGRSGNAHLVTALTETENSIDTLVAMLLFDASAATERVPYQNLDLDRIANLVNVLTQWINTLEGVAGIEQPNVTQRDLFAAGASILKGAVAINALLTTEMNLEQIRAERYQYLGALTRFTPGQSEPSASDMTLAALPRPTPDLMRLCQSQGNTSTAGRLYVKLHQLVAHGRYPSTTR